MNNTKSELEHLKKLKSKTNFVKNFSIATQIGAIISLYYFFLVQQI